MRVIYGSATNHVGTVYIYSALWTPRGLNISGYVKLIIPVSTSSKNTVDSLLYFRIPDIQKYNNNNILINNNAITNNVLFALCNESPSEFTNFIFSHS